MSLLDQQMAERRERLLEAAREILESRGFEGLTMRELARAGGVTVPTIYNLIGSKEDVLFAAVEEQTRAFVSGLAGARGDLVAVLDAAVRQLVRRPRYYRALLLLLLTSDRVDPARRHAATALAAQIAAALAELEAAGELAPWVDPRALAERLHAHFDMASLEWARGILTGPAFRSAALFGAATTLLGVTSGESRERFERLARGCQAGTARRRRPLRAKGRAA